MDTTKKFGVVRRIGNKQVVSLRYTDQELYIRIIRSLHSKGYKVGLDYEVKEYFGVKRIPTFRIDGILLVNDILHLMALTQFRNSEISRLKGEALERSYHELNNT